MGLGWQTWKGHACHLCDGALCGWQGRAGQYPPHGEVDPSMRCLLSSGNSRKGLSSKSTAGAGIMLGKVKTHDLF